ncbi:hypothetical protein MTO96_033556 [Rhipicephalus appendiculatus]
MRRMPALLLPPPKRPGRKKRHFRWAFPLPSLLFSYKPFHGASRPAGVFEITPTRCFYFATTRGDRKGSIRKRSVFALVGGSQRVDFSCVVGG